MTSILAMDDCLPRDTHTRSLMYDSCMVKKRLELWGGSALDTVATAQIDCRDPHNHPSPSHYAASLSFAQTLVGDEINQVANTGNLHFTRPFDRGYLTQWEPELAVWRRLFGENKLKVPEKPSFIIKEGVGAWSLSSPAQPRYHQSHLHHVLPPTIPVSSPTLLPNRSSPRSTTCSSRSRPSRRATSWWGTRRRWSSRSSASPHAAGSPPPPSPLSSTGRVRCAPCLLLPPSLRSLYVSTHGRAREHRKVIES
jgi:hypothetical protein